MSTADGMTRRGLLGATAGALAVAGFDAAGRRWVSVADAASCHGFLDAPALDGTLLLDGGSRSADRTDRGNMVFRTPAAVLRPARRAGAVRANGVAGTKHVPVRDQRDGLLRPGRAARRRPPDARPHAPAHPHARPGNLPAISSPAGR